MRYFTLLLFLFAGALSLAAQDAKSDFQGVEKALRYYLDGGTNGERETVALAFHPQAELKFIRDGEYTELSLEGFLDRIKPGPKSDRQTRIRYIHVAGNAASAAVELEHPDALTVDFFNLLRVDGEWKIVNKIFHRQVKATAPVTANN